MAFQIFTWRLSTRERPFQRCPSSCYYYWGHCRGFSIGLVHEITSIDSENNLVERFGKPTTSVYYDFMTTASFVDGLVQTLSLCERLIPILP